MHSTIDCKNRDAPGAGRQRWLFVLGMVGAVCLAYSSGLTAPFLLDDVASIGGNESIRSLWPLWRVVWYPHGEGRTHDGRPLLNLSLAVN